MQLAEEEVYILPTLKLTFFLSFLSLGEVLSGGSKALAFIRPKHVPKSAREVWALLCYHDIFRGSWVEYYG